MEKEKQKENEKEVDIASSESYILRDIAPQDILIEDRAREDFGNVDELAKSISVQGVISPILVVAIKHPKFKYKLIAGERRTRACLKLNLSLMPAKVFHTHPSAFSLKSLELLENVMRKDMTWSETCKMYKQLYDLRIAQFGADKRGKTGYNAKRLAQELGVTEATVSQYLGLARAVEAAPVLAECKTASDATAMLQKIKQTVENAKYAEALELHQENLTVNKSALLASYVIANCAEYLPTVLAQTYDFVEIDPPYAIDLDNTRNQTDLKSTMYYNEVTINEYETLLKSIAPECFRILRQDSWLICWTSIQHLNRTREIFTSAGFTSAMVPLLWVKPTGQTINPLCNLASSYECCLYFAKGRPIIKKPGTLNVFHSPTIPGNQTFPPRYHPTTRPIELMEQILQCFCPLGAKIFVPFLGSGNTILAAYNLGYTAIGCELSKQYKDGFTRLVGEWNEPKFRSLQKQE